MDEKCKSENNTQLSADLRIYIQIKSGLLRYKTHTMQRPKHSTLFILHLLVCVHKCTHVCVKSGLLL
jgi:hypothetical protein